MEAKLVKVLFLQNRKVQAVDGPFYEAGKIYELSADSADRWEARGVARRATAEDLKPAKAAAEVKKGGPGDDPPPDTVQIPDAWRDLPYFELLSLASKLSKDPVRNKVECVAAVEAELARRAKEIAGA